MSPLARIDANTQPDTPVELELSAAELHALSDQHAGDRRTSDVARLSAEQQAKVLVPSGRHGAAASATRKSRFQPPASRLASAITAATAVAVLGVVVYLISHPAPRPEEPAALPPAPASAPMAPQSAAAPADERPPVRYRNPFDHSEIFEFPPGTSPTEAHDAVAQILMQRAQDRMHHPHLRADALNRPRTMTAQANQSR